MASRGRHLVYLAADFTWMIVAITGRPCGTERKCNKSTIHEVGFGRRQFARASATQHSILVFHILIYLLASAVIPGTVAKHITKENRKIVNSALTPRDDASLIPKWKVVK